jgi:hypothetical protein
MEAASKTPGGWARIISGVFLLFAITGIVIKRKAD